MPEPQNRDRFHPREEGELEPARSHNSSRRRCAGEREGSPSADRSWSPPASHTGRAANDKFIVRNAVTDKSVWWGKVNKPFPQEKFDRVFEKMERFPRRPRRWFVLRRIRAARTPSSRIPVRVITQLAWPQPVHPHHAAAREGPGEYDRITDPFTIIDLPAFQTSKDRGRNQRPNPRGPGGLPEELTAESPTPEYAGDDEEERLLADEFRAAGRRARMPMHASANIARRATRRCSSGCPGTGKTTLSAGFRRTLIGDDEPRCGVGGVFNFEGGLLRESDLPLSEADPKSLRDDADVRYRLENVVMEPEHAPSSIFSDATLAENTPRCYPIRLHAGTPRNRDGGQPKNGGDAHVRRVRRAAPDRAPGPRTGGVLLPLRLYGKVRQGTEIGVKEPQATVLHLFSALRSCRLHRRCTASFSRKTSPRTPLASG